MKKLRINRLKPTATVIMGITLIAMLTSQSPTPQPIKHETKSATPTSVEDEESPSVAQGITLSPGESCEITFDTMVYRKQDTMPPQVILHLNKGMSQLKPGQYFIYQAYSNSFDEKPFTEGGAPLASATIASDSNRGPWQDRQGALRITAVSGTIRFSTIEVTIYTGESVYSSNLSVEGKTKIVKGTDVSKIKIPRQLKLSPRWCGKPLKLPVHAYVRSKPEVNCGCKHCKSIDASLVIDQQQTVYTGGTNAIARQGYGFWQSFTPSKSGTLERLDVAFFGDMSGQGVLTVYSGEGIGGKKLFSSKVRVVAAGYKAIWNVYTVGVPVVAEKTYTYLFTPDPANMPDHYGVCVGTQNPSAKNGENVAAPYTRGTYAIIDPAGESKLNTMSSVFRIYLRSPKE